MLPVLTVSLPTSTTANISCQADVELPASLVRLQHASPNPSRSLGSFASALALASPGSRCAGSSPRSSRCEPPGPSPSRRLGLGEGG